MKKVINVTFKGHIVHCRDLDGGTEFNIEVMINDQVKGSELYEICEMAAEKNEIVLLSGNTHEFEYLQPSGRVVRKITTIDLTETSPINPESESLLGISHLE